MIGGVELIMTASERGCGRADSKTLSRSTLGLNVPDMGHSPVSALPENFVLYFDKCIASIAHSLNTERESFTQQPFLLISRSSVVGHFVCPILDLRLQRTKARSTPVRDEGLLSNGLLNDDYRRRFRKPHRDYLRSCSLLDSSEHGPGRCHNCSARSSGESSSTDQL